MSIFKWKRTYDGLWPPNRFINAKRNPSVVKSSGIPSYSFHEMTWSASTTLIWYYVSSISHLGAPFWVNASAVDSGHRPSIPSASGYAGCSFAGETGPGPHWSQNSIPESVAWATACALGLTPTTCQPNPPFAWRSRTPRPLGCSSARIA